MTSTPDFFSWAGAKPFVVWFFSIANLQLSLPHQGSTYLSALLLVDWIQLLKLL